MTALKKTIFISDLHLEEQQPAITEQFLQLLTSCDTDVDALYILGDLFEVWIGDDDDTSLHREIIRALKAKTSAGLPIYFLAGNRDFLIGKKFLRATGCKLLAEETVISLYGKNVLIMHGDTLCTLDVGYLKSRKKLRNPILQWFFLMLPLNYRRKLANKMRKQSEHYKNDVDLEIMDVTQTEVERVMQKHKVNYLIHGHTHQPAFHAFTINNTKRERIVLPAWHGNGTILVWYETGEKQFIELC